MAMGMGMGRGYEDRHARTGGRAARLGGRQLLTRERRSVSTRGCSRWLRDDGSSTTQRQQGDEQPQNALEPSHHRRSVRTGRAARKSGYLKRALYSAKAANVMPSQIRPFTM
jgi:hypothetical protein